MNRITASIAFLILAFLAAAVAATGQEDKEGEVMVTSLSGSCPEGMTSFYIDSASGRNSATFNSEAPLEDIVGTTSSISGKLCFDPANPENGGSGYIRIPVASLDTGIPLRDEDLRNEDWLHAEKYPYIEFVIISVTDFKEVKSDKNSASYDVSVTGDFSVHGETRELTVPARITYLKESAKTRQQLSGDLLAARAEFKIALADFDITGPSGKSLIGSKVGEEIDIEIKLVASSVEPSAGGDLELIPE